MLWSSAGLPAGQWQSLLVDHLAGHPAVDHGIRAGDEAGALAIKQPGNDFGSVCRVPDSTGGMLGVVLAAQGLLVFSADHDPAGADAIDPHVGPEADRERVS